jgi:hypothetical protein
MDRNPKRWAITFLHFTPKFSAAFEAFSLLFAKESIIIPILIEKTVCSV